MKTSQSIIIVTSMFLLATLLLVQSRKHAAIANTSSQTTWSQSDAHKYLDEREQYWLSWDGAARGHGTACLSCHTSVPIALALPTLDKNLGQPTLDTAEKAQLDGVTLRVNDWASIISGSSTESDPCVCYYGDRRPSSLGTEAVLNSLVLVNSDRVLDHGKLQPTTLTSLQYFWDQQQADGSWQWINFGLSPWENNNVYYGTALAAVAVGMAGRDYYDEPDLKSKIDLMRSYLATGYSSQTLHDKIACLWASTWLPGILTSAEKSALIQQISSVQNLDGSWTMAKLGGYDSSFAKWQGGTFYPASSSGDGYATGLIVLTLKRAGLSSSDPVLARGISWLTSNEQSGIWPVDYINGGRDPNTNIGSFMRDASTSYAVMALAEPSRR